MDKTLENDEENCTIELNHTFHLADNSGREKLSTHQWMLTMKRLVGEQ